MGLSGTAPYNYSLNSGTFSTNNFFGGLGVGQYTVTVSDVTGCNILELLILVIISH